MELLKEEKGKKFFLEDETKVYCMLDMGAYVGNRFRAWYEEAPEVWRLMFLDEKRQNGEITHIEALTDERGNYIRLSVDDGEVKRTIQMDNGLVFNDSIVRVSTDKDMFGENYTALEGDIYSKNKIPLNEYLSQKQSFHLSGREYTGPATDNNLITNFFIKNDELLKTIEEKQSKTL